MMGDVDDDAADMIDGVGDSDDGDCSSERR